MPFRSRSSHICTFSRSLHIVGEGACAVGHLGWVRRNRLAVWWLAIGCTVLNSTLPVLAAARSAAVVLVELHLQGDLGIVLAPCEEVVHSPILVYIPCVVVAVLGIETCLDLVVDAANSKEGRSGSAAVQWKGLWEHRCQISLHLRLMRDVQDSHQFSGTQTDLMVVPCFLLHLGGEAVVEDTGRIVARTRLDNALMEVRHRNQTAVC